MKDTMTDERSDQAKDSALTAPDPLGWLFEDTLPAEYPYDAMFPHSQVRGGVRMFPVFAAPPAPVGEPAEWHDEKPDEWTPLIEAAHPLKSHAYQQWDMAVQMVGNRRDKYALVELVCWLLQRAESASPLPQEVKALTDGERAKQIRERVELLEAEVKRLLAEHETLTGGPWGTPDADDMAWATGRELSGVQEVKAK